MTDDVVSGSNGRIRFPGISPRAYEHPVDRGALATLRTIPGFAEVLKAVAGFFSERGERLMALASSIRVGEKQYPELNKLRLECAQALDISPVPNIFVAQDPSVSAYTIGMDEPFIVLSTGLVELLDTNGLRFVIGHEMGHVLSGHAVYRTMLIRLISMQMSMSWTPVSAFGLRAVIAALKEWYRKSELSCDRAGLLCGQDPAAALRVHVLMAGGIDPSRIDIPSFLQQAEEYESVDDVRDSLLKLRNVEHMSHPLAVVRAAQLQKWAASEEYRAILVGDYPRRDGDSPSSTWSDDVKSAAKSYKDSFSNSTDPLAKVFTDVGEALSGAAGKVWNKFGGNRTPNGESEPAN
ncbi:M48 family metallopeptidase [Amycolatopsis magusensis]|uniref:Zn-dependent protease with chaperone function n=1 Tax=Amycolatopsis magusensis TaxID=882444 RepID=A0ABS4Q3I4_9PSEU|nr:M48 family metallopeptidase [Amycolatopsis magusensis]MBP2186254.1 Zn-dependent protease with chaperone function [Amycolatopsis magusensis]MDI5982420.1 M48 family metallopeptidase [Amycolatopsis magusensis]